jgi:hypothetical protein
MVLRSRATPCFLARRGLLSGRDDLSESSAELTRNAAIGVSVALVVGIVLVVAGPGPAAASTPSRMTEAARWTLWYVRIHNSLLATAFGRGERTRSGRFSAPKPGTLRFTDERRAIKGGIRCIPATPQTNSEFGCRWTITVKRRGVYQGLGLIKFYKGGGFNYSALWSRCKPLVDGSTFCQRYPPPNG